MIMPVRTSKGEFINIEIARKMGWFICPYMMHYHSGTELEIETELILCHYNAQKALEEFENGN